MLTRRNFITSAVLLPATSALLPRFAFGQETAPTKAAFPDTPSTNAPWLEEIAKKLQQELHLSAVWLATNIEDNIETAVLGVKKFGDPTPATLDDKLTVASISKPMVALWIATLVEQGKLSYDSKVLDVLPELKASCLPEHQNIVLGQLLTHTAELVRDAAYVPDKLRVAQYPGERIREAKDVLSQPSPAQSLGKSLYSNNGVTLAATMAERVAGEPYEVAATRFYQELGLSSWGVWSMDAKDDLSHPWPHAMNGSTPVPRSLQTIQNHFTRPSGSAHCTISDLARFALLATDSTEAAHSILKPETWATVSDSIPNTITTLSCFSTSGERFAYGHNGSLLTTRSSLLVFPEWKAALAAHTNCASEEFSTRAIDLLQDSYRQRRAQSRPMVSCRLTLTGVTAVDSTWKNEIRPRMGDDNVRIRVNFRVETRNRTGDLKTLVKLGNVERKDNRYLGLRSGNHVLHFEFPNPKTQQVPVTVTLDALGTGVNMSEEAARFSSLLTLA